MAVTLNSVELLAGTDPGDVVVAWEAYITDGEGNRTAVVTMNGLRSPRNGDRVLVFLVRESARRAEHFGGIPTHVPVSMAGFAYLDGDTVVAVDETSQLAAEQLLQQSIQALDAVI